MSLGGNYGVSFKKPSVTSNCTDRYFLYIHNANSWATLRLKPLNFSMNTRQPFLFKSSPALSYDNKVWMPLGSILTIGAMANRRESTQNSEVGFNKKQWSHSPKQNNAMTIQNCRERR
jgi:hypothetical protein